MRIRNTDKKYCFRYITSLKSDPDPYQIGKQDPDPYQKCLDPQHWLKARPYRSGLSLKLNRYLPASHIESGVAQTFFHNILWGALAVQYCNVHHQLVIWCRSFFTVTRCSMHWNMPLLPAPASPPTWITCGLRGGGGSVGRRENVKGKNKKEVMFKY